MHKRLECILIFTIGGWRLVCVELGLREADVAGLASWAMNGFNPSHYTLKAYHQASKAALRKLPTKEKL